jgi:hypothetical protein
MKAHKLKDLNLEGMEQILADEPEFDFYRIGMVLTFQVTWQAGAVLLDCPDILLVTEYAGQRSNYELGVRLEGVRELVMPSIAPRLYLPELEIDDVRGAMLEGIRYELTSHTNFEFRCSCKNIVLLELRLNTPLTGGGR